MSLRKLLKPAHARPPAKVINNQPPDARGRGGIGDDVLHVHARRARHADRGVLAREGRGERLERVVDLDDGEAGWEHGGGVGAGDGRHGEVGAAESCCDGGAEGA